MHTTSQPTLFPAEQKPQEETPQWFVMRDLKRANAKLPAYKQLAEAHIEVFTPMRWRIATRRDAQIREEKPLVRDLLFAHATRSILDPIVERTPTLQYRYVRGAYCQPMVVKDKDMQRFIGAVEASDTPRFYLPGELSAAQCGQMIRIIGGPLNGYEGRLLSIRGSKTKRLLIELPGILSVGVEVEPEYIQLIKDNKQKYNQIQNKKKPDYNMEYKRNIIITGGAGFIGSHVVRLFVNKYPDYHIINVDKLTYAGNLANLKDIENKPNYSFVKADICDFETICQLMEKFHVDGIIHLAAESHVDRSIKDPFTFARTNVMGTLSLLQAAKLYWEAQPERYEGKRFYHISTDEVYGALELTHPEGIKSEHSAHRVYGDDFFEETTKYNPHSPYSASKASSDHFVRAFHDTYGMPTVVTNCSNNYGPYQFPEKLIPLFINNIRHKKPLPVYGKGENVRDWLYVEDHARAIDLIFHKGRIADTYNIGGFNEWKNIDIIKVIIKTVDRLLGNPEGHSLDLITYVTDRKGHDMRYAIDSSKLHTELGWEPSLQFEEGIEKTVQWYLDNQEWMDNVTSGDYQKYYEEMYKGR